MPFINQLAMNFIFLTMETVSILCEPEPVKMDCPAHLIPVNIEMKKTVIQIFNQL